MSLGHYPSAGRLACIPNEVPAHRASVAVDKRRVRHVYYQTRPPGTSFPYEPRSLMPVTIGVDPDKGSHTACTPLAGDRGLTCASCCLVACSFARREAGWKSSVAR